MEKKDFRVIKISKHALYEFIYEKFIEEQDSFMDLNSVDTINSFDIDYENGSFIFMAHQAEDSEGKSFPLPEEVDLKKLMRNMDDTTSTMFSAERYKDFSLKELLDIQNNI